LRCQFWENLVNGLVEGDEASLDALEGGDGGDYLGAGAEDEGAV
jgi:hypothetical protein